MNTFLSAWTFDVLVLTNVAVAATLYAFGVRRVNARSHRARNLLHGRWPIAPTACFMSGLALIAIAYSGPLAAWSHTFFWVHMTQHLIITMGAAPLLVLGAPITLAFRAGGPATRRRIVRVLRTRAVAILTDPIVTWVLFATMLLAAHFTGFYDWALTNHGVMALIEQPGFLIVATLYYLPLIGSNLLPRRPSHAQRLISLGLMMIPEAMVGAVVYFSPVVLYDAYETVRPFGLEPLPDQQLAGALMWGLVMVIDAFWMMWVAADWYSSEERRGHRESARMEQEETRSA